MSESADSTSEPEEPTPAAPAENRIRELTVRLDDLEEELERKDSSIRAVRTGQEELAESIDEVNDTVRQLLGVYDQLTTEQNPFAEPDEPLFDTTGATAHAETAPPQPVAVETGDSDDAPAQPPAGEPTHEPAGGDDTVSFDDLRDASEEEFLWEADEEPVASEADDPLDEAALEAELFGESAEAEARVDEATETTDSGPDHDGLWLGSLPCGYAGDVLVMEWLAVLMSRTGPAGAFRAVRHYEEIGWISPEVKRGLVDLLGGPDLDLHVDPSRPAEPTAADHQDSVAFIRTLSTLSNL
ncbi:FlaD/FlaE family flagellar protein [Natronomonas sp. EA1]|uniref:FlaD/FlaE family flagellar protein n=1 Tax=Natronomonas sp. EA1 TaxID=3421655 RepID=UPI003EBCE96E